VIGDRKSVIGESQTEKKLKPLKKLTNWENCLFMK